MPWEGRDGNLEALSLRRCVWSGAGLGRDKARLAGQRAEAEGKRAGKQALELPSRGASHGPQPRSGQQSVVSPSQAVMSRVAGGCHLMSMA